MSLCDPEPKCMHSGICADASLQACLATLQESNCEVPVTDVFGDAALFTAPLLSATEAAALLAASTNCETPGKHYMECASAAHVLWRRLSLLSSSSALQRRFPGWRVCGVNAFLRLKLADKGMTPHCDGAFIADANTCSKYSIVVYLNDNFALGSGQTTFFKPALETAEFSLQPVAGLAVIFDQNITHAASDPSALKGILRADLLFERTADRAPVEQNAAADMYNEACAVFKCDPGCAQELQDAALALCPSLEDMILKL